ncbi:uncharacterized protein EURHEDRAFT_411977 [Aspergillus ruber CBS 135680]|uniref:Uncharacterized protein n=1 Tax=Aspergillus ruber (strain CBS 135680) TaxID=1388766 RepID=A0A017SFB5_ASPRC|nr:uncharacterized protein EURHEDRAFT_411977 [Aspergillus ruber CBS 135680]EYE95703.1 hypothetical protein EURHEDRAFT_411977 [Aspergillus ruber CBS 135680]
MVIAQITQGISSTGRSIIQNRNKWSAPLDKAKRKAILLRRSLIAHQPVWFAGGGAAYTTVGAVYLTLRYLRRIR